MDLTDYRLRDELADSSLVSPEIYDFLHGAALHPHSPVQIFKRHSSVYLQKILNISYVFLGPYIDATIAALSHAPPEAAAVAFLVFLLAAVWIVLGFVRRLISFATRLALRVVFWGAVVAGLAVVWQRGALETLRDLVVLCGKAAGFAAVVKDVWVGELRRYEEEARVQGRR